MESPQSAPGPDAIVAPPPRFLRALRTRERSGQAIVEFAMVSVAFLMLVFGTIDFGRVIFMYSQLHNSVREGARYGKMNPTDNYAIENVVISSAENLGIQPGNIDIHCTGGCYPGCSDVTVEATAQFVPLTARLLGLGADDLPIMMHSSATVTAE
jgi:Flp pilus assembly protein TadG